MKNIFFSIILTFLTLNIAFSQEGWDIQLIFLNDHVLPAEPIFRYYKMENNSNIPLPKLTYSHYSIDGTICGPLVTASVDPDWGSVSKSRPTFPQSRPTFPKQVYLPVGYKDEYMGAINIECLFNWPEFKYGEHTFCYHFKEGPKVCANFYLKQPTGIEAEAYKIILDNAYEEYEDELNRRIKHLRFYDVLDCKFPDILRNYPSSIYTAWIYYSKIFDPTNMKVEEAIGRLKRNVYTDIELHAPEPDPDKWDIYNGRIMKGRRTISSAPEVALWRKEKSELILRYHPDFPFANKLKVQIALCNISLGREEEGISQLQNLIKQAKSEPENPHQPIKKEAEWAEKFLQLWEKGSSL